MTKYKVEIHKHGYNNSSILKMIAMHNEGLVPFQIPDFLSFQSSQRALDSFSKEFHISRDEGKDNVFHVSEDGGKTLTLTVEEIEIYELQDSL